MFFAELVSSSHPNGSSSIACNDRVNGKPVFRRSIYAQGKHPLSPPIAVLSQSSASSLSETDELGPQSSQLDAAPSHRFVTPRADLILAASANSPNTQATQRIKTNNDLPEDPVKRFSMYRGSVSSSANGSHCVSRDTEKLFPNTTTKKLTPIHPPRILVPRTPSPCSSPSFGGKHARQYQKL